MVTTRRTIQRFVINGQEYDSLEAMPPQVRREWDSLMAHAERLRAANFTAGGADDDSPKSAWRALSLLQRVAVSWFLLSITLVCWEISVRPGFLVSPAYLRVAVWPAGALSIALTLSFLTVPSVRRALRPQGGVFSTYLLFAPFVAAFMCLAMMWPLPDALNKLAGQGFSDVYTVSRTQYQSGRGAVCERVYIRELEDHWFGKLCVSDKTFAVLRAGNRIELAGTRSWFGVDTKAYAD